MTRPSSKLLALALTVSVLGACTARDTARAPAAGPRYASLDAAVDARPSAGPGIVQDRTATPVAVLPDWIGRPGALREQDTPEAFDQVVTLGATPRGARDNVVLLHLSRTPEAAAGQAVSPTAITGRPSEAGIRAELAASFPDTAMRVVTRPAKNAYGPYGLAVGRSPRGARCLYAWQWIAEAPALDPAGASGPLGLRARICRDDVTFEALAAAMNQIRLVPRFAGTPVAQAGAARPAASRRRAGPRGNAQVSQGKVSEGQVSQGQVSERQVPATATAQTWPAVAPGPLPAGRRYLGVADAPAAQPEPARSAGPGPAVVRSAFVGAAPPPQAGIVSADLPPEALRGPVPRSANRP